jgi:hypothetical protein
VVLLVDHDRDALVAVDRDAARALATGELAADQVALDEHRALELVDRVEVDDRELFGQARLAEPLHDEVEQLARLRFGQARREAEALQVARQPRARADRDVVLGAGALQPRAGAELGRLVAARLAHGRAPSPRSARRRSSRSRAASS